MKHDYRPLQHTLRKRIATCCCYGFFFFLTLMLLYTQASHASLEPANNHLNTPALSQDNISAPLSKITPKQNISITNPRIANPKLSLSTHMSSIDLPDEALAATPAKERDELLIAARAQPTQNHSDLGAAGAQDSKAVIVTEVKAEASKVEKIYKEENNYLLALALILLTAGTIAFVLFFKWQ